MCIIPVREVPDFDFNDCPFSAVMKNLNFDHSLPCCSVGWCICQLFSKIYVNSFSIKSHLQWVCTCSGCTLYLTHMRRRTAPLVYLKFCAQISGFSWATHDWSRGWHSRQGDGVETRRPRHLQRSCPLDNHSKICQLSVLSTWLIACVLLAHANPPALM